MSELTEQSLADTCRHIKSGAQTSEQVTQAVLARIQQLEPSLHAFARLFEDQALERARELDAARARGEPLGLLHGVPIAVKDLLYMQGAPTASGTLVMADFEPDYTATVIHKLHDAGAVIVGKTQLTEGAFGSHHPQITPPVNPWNANHWPGVSSSGSGVAVASGMVFGALGSDTGGSIRFPSASCGLVGIKPTYGRVSRHGAFALAESLDHIGPMTRSVEDAARLLQAISGADPHDATSLDAPPPTLPDSADISGLRIGVDWDYVSGGVAPVVVRTVREALRVLADAGAEVIEVTLPPQASMLINGWGLTTARECRAAHKGLFPEQRELYGPVLRGLLDLGADVSDEIYQTLELARVQFRQAMDEVLAQVDMMISPCMTDLPRTVDEMERTAAEDDERAAFITFTAPFDYSGHPTLTLPMDLEHGLPTSFQLIGRYLEEPLLVRAGLAFEAHHPFEHRPDLGV